MSPVILAIEGSQRSMSVALSCAGGAVRERTAEGDPRERDLLLPAIDALLEEAQVERTSLDAVAVSTGPGGFTGLRVSVATAKGVCEALGIPAIDVPSCLVAAQATRASWDRLGARVAVALASKGDGCWLSTVAAVRSGLCVEDERWCEGDSVRSGPCALLADGHAPRALRDGALERGIGVIEPLFTARACLEVALPLFEAGTRCDALRLQVRYPREPEAVLNWRARYGTLPAPPVPPSP